MRVGRRLSVHRTAHPSQALLDVTIENSDCDSSNGWSVNDRDLWVASLEIRNGFPVTIRYLGKSVARVLLDLRVLFVLE